MIIYIFNSLYDSMDYLERTDRRNHASIARLGGRWFVKVVVL